MAGAFVVKAGELDDAELLAFTVAFAFDDVAFGELILELHDVARDADDFAFIIDEENINGFVSSNRPGGVGKDDIHALKKIKPICDILLESTVVDSKTNNPIETALTSISDGTGVIENTKESNVDG